MIRRTKQNEVGMEHISTDQERSKFFYSDPQTLYTKNLLLDDFRKLGVNVEKRQKRLRDPLKIVDLEQVKTCLHSRLDTNFAGLNEQEKEFPARI